MSMSSEYGSLLSKFLRLTFRVQVAPVIMCLGDLDVGFFGESANKFVCGTVRLQILENGSS